MNAQCAIEKRDNALSYKYQRVRERLRQAIERGEFTGKLPGERVLAGRYEANAKTINKALSDLTIDGLLVRHVGRGTFVVDGSTTAAGVPVRSRTFGWLAAAGPTQPGSRRLYHRAANMLREKGHRLELFQLPTDSSGELTAAGLTPGQLRGMSGLVLFSACPSTSLLADLHRRHLPVVIANNRHERIRTPAVLADHAHGALDLTQHLIHLGHRAIQLMIDVTLLPGALAAESGYQAATQRYELDAREPWHVTNGVDWQGSLRAENRPTALVCVGAQLAAQAAAAAADAGLSVPDELSIAAMPEPGEALLAEHNITAYEVDADCIVDWAIELLLSASPGELPRMVIVPGKRQDRDSTAPPACYAQSVRAPGETIV